MKVERLVCDVCERVIPYGGKLDADYSGDSEIGRVILNTPVLSAAVAMDLCGGCVKGAIEAAQVLLRLERAADRVMSQVKA